MNKAAVAMAADSAVTIGGERQPKIFNTVNKLFMLSKRHPVGVMVYGNAQFMRVPWETIVKVYRSNLRDKSFPHLEGYASDFLRYIEGNELLFPKGNQDEHCLDLISALYRCVNNDIEEAIKKHIEKTGKVSVEAVRKHAKEQIQVHFDILKGSKALKGFGLQFESKFRKKYSAMLKRLHKQCFQKLPLSPADIAKLRKMSVWVVTKDNFIRLRGKSGLVVAGFGEKDIFPRLTEFVLGGVVLGKLRCAARRTQQIGPGCSVSIIPFAQTEVVRGFIDGIDPDLERLLNKFLDEVFANYPTVLLEHVKGIGGAAKTEAIKKAKLASEGILKKFRQTFETFRTNTLVDPIVTTVSALPKEELAAMAEALVNLTSFKRRFSPNAETVGGPIDVAVISKGDGFIWVRRKYYFKPELNPQFSTNYYKDA